MVTVSLCVNFNGTPSSLSPSDEQWVGNAERTPLSNSRFSGPEGGAGGPRRRPADAETVQLTATVRPHLSSDQPRHLLPPLTRTHHRPTALPQPANLTLSIFIHFSFASSRLLSPHTPSFFFVSVLIHFFPAYKVNHHKATFNLSPDI